MSAYTVNPRYADVLEPVSVTAAEPSFPHDGAGAVREINSFDDAVTYLRAALVSRTEHVAFYYRTPYYELSQMAEVFDAAIGHTGVPTEGDYLAWQFAGYTRTISSFSDLPDYMLFEYDIQYYTTAAQEAAVTAAVNELIDTLGVGGMNDYDIIETIYDYVCDNVEYDYRNLYNNSYTLKYTAYAALMNGTSVCQGYSVLLYRLLLEAGIDCRFVYGRATGNELHSWNIVGLGDVYYHLDATWDAEGSGHDYFLCASLEGHTLSSELQTASFREEYPMSTEDYPLMYGLDTPQITYAAAVDNAVQLRWGAVEDGNYYLIYRCVNGGLWELRDIVSGTSYYDEGLYVGVSYTYCLLAYSRLRGYSAFGATRTVAISNPFTDVKETDAWYSAVMWAYNNGIVKGTSATTFSPGSDCTRGQFVLMLYRMAGKPDVSGVANPFKDIKKSDAYYKAVLWAYSQGIIKGTSATRFSPSGSVTRGQLVLMLYRMAGKPSTAGAVNPFNDVYAADSYYKAVLWAAKVGVTRGTSSTTFSPQANCTRGQLALFLYRYNNL